MCEKEGNLQGVRHVEHGVHGLLVMGRVLSEMIPGTLMAFNFGTYQRKISSAFVLKLKELRVNGPESQKDNLCHACITDNSFKVGWLTSNQNSGYA